VSKTTRVTFAATTHGVYLIDRPATEQPLPLLVGFHGYAERADDMMEALRQIRGSRSWMLVSIQALNRFYTKSQDVVANWMTREDRELVIADNISYVRAVIGAVRRDYETTGTVVYAGFSQGVAMAYRAAAFITEQGTLPGAAGGVMLAGDVPPDVTPHLGSLPPILIGRGTEDGWYTESKAAADIDQFRRAGVEPQVHVFAGGHEWNESFVDAAGRFLDDGLGAHRRA
jgi:predicted esterase